MSARMMYDSLNQRAPHRGAEKHHGNKRKALASMKVKARRAERKNLNDTVKNKEISE